MFLCFAFERKNFKSLSLFSVVLCNSLFARFGKQALQCTDRATAEVDFDVSALSDTAPAAFRRGSEWSHCSFALALLLQELQPGHFQHCGEVFLLTVAQAGSLQECKAGCLMKP